MSTGRVRRLELFLVRPTTYDDDGYLVRHLWGVLPTNTLACLHALSEDVRRRGVLGDVALRIHLCDESVQAVPERRMTRLARRSDTRVVLALVGVQTSQFPRACDLALRFRTRGCAVMIGGFHVSGTLAMLPERPTIFAELMAAGVTLVRGEVEDAWPRLLEDAVRERLAPLYDFGAARPTLTSAPVPCPDPRLLRRFVRGGLATLDAGRGCPFACSFCTIINVQGRTMRGRDAALVAAAVETAHRHAGTTRFFFTDDNFARHPHWREIFLALIRLRERGLPLSFLMQVDLLAHRIPDFVELARRAGCFQVFLGMESLSSRNLQAAGKRQNKVADYAALIARWHAAEVLTHVGFIIGFPDDTPGSVERDVLMLRDEIRPDVASFFMLTPLPGSADHARLVAAGTALDEDLCRYDTFHPVVDHPNMTRAEWYRSYRSAWDVFYTREVMRRQLAATPPQLRATLLQIYFWYLTATRVDGAHPMLSGFVRRKPRRDRRDRRVDGPLRYWQRRVPELAAVVYGYGRIVADLRDVRAGTDPSVSRRERPQSWLRFFDEMLRGAPPLR